MTPEKVTKLRELAERGIGGEKENARSILTKNGIDWRKPAEKIWTKVKQVFNVKTTHEYSFDFTKSTDLLLLQVLCNNTTGRTCKMNVHTDLKIRIALTPGEYTEVKKLYERNSTGFYWHMYEHAISSVNIDFSKK